MMKKVFLYVLEGLVFLIVVLFCYSWWYRLPSNVVGRITGIFPPIFSDVLFSKEDSSWQDAHLIYVFKLSNNFSEDFILGCENAGFRKSIYDYKKFTFVIDDVFKNSTVDVGQGLACFKSFSEGNENWDIVVDNGYLFFEYYLYDRPEYK